MSIIELYSEDVTRGINNFVKLQNSFLCPRLINVNRKKDNNFSIDLTLLLLCYRIMLFVYTKCIKRIEGSEITR